MTTQNERAKVLYAPVSGELHRSVRIQAIEEGRSVAKLVTEAVEEYMNRSRTPNQGRPLVR